MSAAPATAGRAAREDRAAAAALAGLPGMGPRRLSLLVGEWGPSGAWHLLVGGQVAAIAPRLAATVPDGHRESVDGQLRAWITASRSIDPEIVLAAHEAAGVRVLLLGDPGYPEGLAPDVEAPVVLFAQGSLDAVGPTRVAVVGTRRCTGVGAGMARELGRDLAAAGVSVVSGLALGIDGAAHRGVLDARATHAEAARPIGVVGSGVDVVYPVRHRALWADVAATGVLISEAPLGCRPAAWRFPARNRLIAALASVVVVVESHAAGGSLHTVAEALRRDIDVMAVPGSVRNPAAAGTNQLLADGCHPVRDADDVLVALGLSQASRAQHQEHRPAPTATEQQVLDAFGWEPATLEDLAVRTTLPVPELAVAIEGLVAAGWARADGGWYERVAAPC